MIVKLKNIKANPYRDMVGFPLSEEKVAALISSFERTGFWDNLIARKLKGEIQIAYGHHRLAALKRMMGEDYEIDINIRDFTDSEMIQILADDNMAELRPEVRITDEVVNVCAGHLHTSKAEPISKMLGWNIGRVRNSLNRLGLVHSGKLSKAAVYELPSETHAIEFQRAVTKYDIEPGDQDLLSSAIIKNDLSKREVKGLVRNFILEKKHPAKDKVVLDFNNKITQLASQFDSLSNAVEQLTDLQHSIGQISDNKGLISVADLLLSMIRLEVNIETFKSAMTKSGIILEND